MKIYLSLACDFGHSWGGFLDEEAEVPDVCPEGHEVVTRSKMPPIDQVQITIRPAGRLVHGRPVGENKVQVIVSDIQGTWEYRSQQLYSWREAEAVVRRFEKRSLAQAKAIIGRSQQMERAI